MLLILFAWGAPLGNREASPFAKGQDGTYVNETCPGTAAEASLVVVKGEARR